MTCSLGREKFGLQHENANIWSVCPLLLSCYIAAILFRDKFENFANDVLCWGRRLSASNLKNCPLDHVLACSDPVPRLFIRWSWDLLQPPARMWAALINKCDRISGRSPSSRDKLDHELYSSMNFRSFSWRRFAVWGRIAAGHHKGEIFCQTCKPLLIFPHWLPAIHEVTDADHISFCVTLDDLFSLKSPTHTQSFRFRP